MSAQTLGSIHGDGRKPARNDNARLPKGVAERRRRSSKDAARVIEEFQSDTAAIESRPDPLLARITLHLLAVMVIMAVVWASWSFLDRVVSARGKVVTADAGLVLQPIETAIVRTIDVRVGDIVRSGQVLATLDPTFTQADVAQLAVRKESLEAQVARLEAELRNTPYTIDTATASEHQLLQMALWRERQALYAAQMSGFEQRLARLRVTVSKNESDRDHLAKRLKVIKEIEQMRDSLAAQQVGSRLNLLLATDNRIEIERNLGLIQNETVEAQHEMQALEAERNVSIQQWQGRIVEDLVARRNELSGVTEQLVKAQKYKDLVHLTAPTDAVVLEIAQRSVGSVVQEAEPLIKLVPLDAKLEIEAQIVARDVANVAVGDPVQVKLDTFNFMEYGMIEGKVLTISEDAFTTKDGRPVEQPYYRARIEIVSTEKMTDLPDNFRLIPGTPLTAEIKVGERSVLSYFLRPIMRGFKEGLREP